MSAMSVGSTDDVMLFGPERELFAEIRQLTALVGELTVMLVVQGAYLAAARAQRTSPDATDVDVAIADVADHVPDHVAEGLWSAREALLARFHNESVAARDARRA